jgi:hypothetical protein
MERAPVKTANESRSEAGWMREFALGATDPEVLEEIEVQRGSAPVSTIGIALIPAVTMYRQRQFRNLRNFQFWNACTLWFINIMLILLVWFLALCG